MPIANQGRGKHVVNQGGGKPTEDQSGSKHVVNQGGGKPRPYNIPCVDEHEETPYIVGAGLAPALATRFLCLLLASFFLCSGFALCLMSSSQKALAQGNAFFVTMLGSSQQPGFAPDLLTVHIYDTVVFVNSAAVPIAIAATDTSFSSPAIDPGKQWKVTFNSMGAFEYHENSPTPRTFGVIVVVPNAVVLLPSPAPAAQETAIAYIQDGKTPPDTVWKQVTLPVQIPVALSPTQDQRARTLSVPPLALLISFARPVILVVVVLFALLAVGLGGFWLYRRREFHQKEDDDEEEDDDDTDE